MSSFNPATFNPHDPAFLADPFPTYSQFRIKKPVAHVMPYNSWWCFRYAECERILTDDVTFVKKSPLPPTSVPPLAVLDLSPKSVFESDNPHHDQVRPVLDSLLAKAMANASMMATQLAEKLLIKAKAARRFELINSFATPLPAGVLQQILGVAQNDMPTLMQWVEANVLANDIEAPMAVKGAGLTCALALTEYFNAMSRCPVQHQSSPSLFDLMRTEGLQGPQPITNDDVVANARTMMIAGYASTTFLIGSGTVRLTENPDQMELLRREPELLDNAVHEMLRIDSPVQLIDRYLTKEVTLGDVTLQRGDKVTAVTGSANHDESVFDDPDRFDVTRSPQRHFGFGMGIHECLGAPLVRKVAPAAFRVLLAQLPNLRVEGTVVWQSDPFLRAPSNVPIAYG
ncbi:MAG: cytochrome P450 [Cyanobium sp.]|jgi:cytochrome P450